MVFDIDFTIQHLLIRNTVMNIMKNNGSIWIYKKVIKKTMNLAVMFNNKGGGGNELYFKCLKTNSGVFIHNHY